jgi:pantetheine-phosphate adenylyltransferase
MKTRTPYSIFDSFTAGTPFALTKVKFNEILARYSELHRRFHTMAHVMSFMSPLEESNDWWKDEGIGREFFPYFRAEYATAALFHDVVYDPRSKVNELKSIELFCSTYGVPRGISDGRKDEFSFTRVIDLIASTARHDTTVVYFKPFCEMDMSGLFRMDTDIPADEMKIFQEYQFCSLDVYRKGRIEFLESVIGTTEYPSVIRERIRFVKNFRPRIGIFAGSFNPFHVGHMNVIRKAERMFDKVLVCCGRNVGKGEQPFVDEDRYKSVCATLPFHQVVHWSGLLTDLVTETEKLGAEVHLVKGFRTDHDIPYEMALLWHMRRLKPDLSVVYIPCDHEYVYISSSSIRELRKFSAPTAEFEVHDYDYAKNS